MVKIGKFHKKKNQNLVRFFRDGRFETEYLPKPYNIGLVFGKFDPLHFGHIRLFRRAKRYCEILYACTESDGVIEKEQSRKAFTKQRERIADLYGVKYLSGVYCRTKTEDRKNIIDKVKPDVLFLGSDWKDKDWEGKHFGIKIIYLKRTPEISSTYLRNNLK